MVRLTVKAEYDITVIRWAQESTHGGSCAGAVALADNAVPPESGDGDHDYHIDLRLGGLVADVKSCLIVVPQLLGNSFTVGIILSLIRDMEDS